MVTEIIPSAIKTLHVVKETLIAAPAEIVFQTLLEPHGPMQEMKMKLEPWPGGRWFRDLGDGNGHCWGMVQAIKRPTLLEFSGPLFMSQPVANNIQYRLSEEGGETLIKFTHTGFGLISEEHKGIKSGWSNTNELVRKRAEQSGS